MLLVNAKKENRDCRGQPVVLVSTILLRKEKEEIEKEGF